MREPGPVQDIDDDILLFEIGAYPGEIIHIIFDLLEFSQVFHKILVLRAGFPVLYSPAQIQGRGFFPLCALYFFRKHRNERKTFEIGKTFHDVADKVKFEQIPRVP